MARHLLRVAALFIALFAANWALPQHEPVAPDRSCVHVPGESHQAPTMVSESTTSKPSDGQDTDPDELPDWLAANKSVLALDAGISELSFKPEQSGGSWMEPSGTVYRPPRA